MKFRLILAPQADEEVVATVHERSNLTDEIEALILRYSGADRVCAYAEDEMKLLNFSDIECITVLGGKTYAIDTSAQQYRLKLRLYEVEGLLPSSFFKINKSSLANENRIDRFSTSFNGAIDVIFKCGYRDYVSRRCFSMIKRRFEQK